MSRLAVGVLGVHHDRYSRSGAQGGPGTMGTNNKPFPCFRQMAASISCTRSISLTRQGTVAVAVTDSERQKAARVPVHREPGGFLCWSVVRNFFQLCPIHDLLRETKKVARGIPITGGQCSAPARGIRLQRPRCPSFTPPLPDQAELAGLNIVTRSVSRVSPSGGVQSADLQPVEVHAAREA